MNSSAPCVQQLNYIINKILKIEFCAFVLPSVDFSEYEILKWSKQYPANETS